MSGIEPKKFLDKLLFRRSSKDIRDLKNGLCQQCPKFLIVKTSSLGDIIQAFSALSYLKKRFPNATIDWVVEERFVSIVTAHPLVDSAISFNLKPFLWYRRIFWRSLWRSFKILHACSYDAVFDLQGNCKSGFVTIFSRGLRKVGFGIKSVREWPNVLATRTRFEISRTLNIRNQYIGLLQQFFKDVSPVALEGVRFKIHEEERGKIEKLLASQQLQRNNRIMVCPGSKWVNKQLTLECLSSLIGKIEQVLQCSFIFVWGSDEEKEICLSLQRSFSSCSIVIEPLDFPVWQNLMNEMDLVIAVDSSALHLCGTTSTPSFSIFGPTSPDVFKPVGSAHFAFQGICPYRQAFEKQCPYLRSCPTGACIHQIKPDDLFDHFCRWWKCRCS